MLTCKEISKLVSESLDRKLPFGLRMEMRLHLMMCSLCRMYRKRTLILRNILSQYDPSLGEDSAPVPGLSEQASARIQKALSHSTV